MNVQADGLPLADVLRQALATSGLQFAIDPVSRVYITRGAAIETQLPTDFLAAPTAGRAPSTGPALAPTPLATAKLRAGSASEFKLYEIGPRQALAAGGKATLVGHVREARTGEPVVGASVYLDSPNIGVATDQFGTYALTMPTGRHTLNIRGIGIKASKRQLMLYADGRLDIEAQEDVTTLKEVAGAGRAGPQRGGPAHGRGQAGY